jgi:hypothetical protein
MSKIAGRVNQFGIVCLFYTGIAFAPEKHSRIDSSDLIATGRLTNFVAYPWFDGWHISGDIVIDRVLGTKVPLTTREISYAFVCCCSWSSIRELRRISETSGIWYLRSKAGSWQPAGWSCGDPGYSPIRTRKDLEDLRRAIVSQGNRLVGVAPTIAVVHLVSRAAQPPLCLGLRARRRRNPAHPEILPFRTITRHLR